MKTVALSGGKSLRVYDGLFPLKFRIKAFDFATASQFVIGWEDGPANNQLAHRYLHSQFSYEDVTRLGILDQIANSAAAEELTGLTLVKTILNLSLPSDAHFVHTHTEHKVVLYYVNLVWNDGWHGETLFFDDTCKEIDYASAYVPGRIIVFPGDVPHTIRPQSNIADKHRFSLSLFFDKC